MFVCLDVNMLVIEVLKKCAFFSIFVPFDPPKSATHVTLSYRRQHQPGRRRPQLYLTSRESDCHAAVA